MAYNKVIYGGNTLIDLTEDTVTADKILTGYTAHDKSGAAITGVAAGEITWVKDADELAGNWNVEDGFMLSYDSADTGLRTYITNTLTASKGILEETTAVGSASTWYLEEVSGYTDRFYIYTILNGENQYLYNNTSGGANFLGFSTTTKGIFVVTYANDYKFYFKLSTANKWLQHSKGGGGIRFYTDNANAANSQITLTYKVNAIVPYGTLTITENGTYDVTNCKRIIVNVS